MFEVGKKYVYKNGKEVLECLSTVDNGRIGWLLMAGYPPRTFDFSSLWKEHKEPRIKKYWLIVWEDRRTKNCIKIDKCDCSPIYRIGQVYGYLECIDIQEHEWVEKI